MASDIVNMETSHSSDEHDDCIELGDISDEDLPVEDVSGEGGSHAVAVQIQNRAAEFLTYVKQVCVSTQVTVDSVLQGVDGLFKLYNQFLQTKLFELSEEDTIKKDDVSALFSYLNQQSIFQGVHSKHRLERFQQKKWQSLVPQKIILSWKKSMLHGKIKPVPNEVVYYIDFLEQLELILQSQDVLDCIDKPRVSSSNVFKSALDGYAYQNHPVREKHPDALGIIYYLDDVVPIESLSSYKDHSYRDFSWTLANLHPELRSCVLAINLSTLAKASVAKKYKNRPMVKNFVEGINKLSSDEGVTFTIRGIKRVFHGFLLFVIGDYPASANLGGFKESAAFAWRFCRQCMITQLELRFKTKESEVTLRSEDMHKQQLLLMAGEEIEEDPDSEEIPTWETEEEPQNLSVRYGINFSSPLLELDYFDPTKAFPQDIMHLFLEGILEVACRLLLNHAISDKKLKLKQVNLFIANHNYGKLQTDKPSPISSQHLQTGLHQSSSQMMMLCFLIPFIVKDHCDSAKLKNYVLLLMIFSMCMSRETAMEAVDILSKLISEYLMEFNVLYPGKMTAKHHFLLHLPNQIIYYGPLTEQWAMRFEAFHAKLKRLTKILHSAKNLMFSLITRMCASQAFGIHKNHTSFLSESVVKAVPKRNILVSSVLFHECLTSCLKISEDSEVQELSSLKWYGPTFSKEDTFMLSQGSENILPRFATVVELYSHKDRYVFVYRELHTIAFCWELNAYEVKCSEVGCFGAIDVTNKCNVLQLMLIPYGSKYYVLLRQCSNPDFSDICSV